MPKTTKNGRGICSGIHSRFCLFFVVCYRLKHGFHKCILVSMVMLHVIIAFASIVFAICSLVKPSRRAITADWILITLTIVSGMVLVILEPAHMLYACIAGLVFVIVASALTLAADVRYKSLRKQQDIL